MIAHLQQVETARILSNGLGKILQNFATMLAWVKSLTHWVYCTVNGVIRPCKLVISFKCDKAFSNFSFCRSGPTNTFVN
jgi:hypothetical protein